MTNEQAMRILRRAEPTRPVLLLLRDVRDRCEPEAQCPAEYVETMRRMGLLRGAEGVSL